MNNSNLMLITQKYLIENNVPDFGAEFENARRFFKKNGVKWSYDRTNVNRRVILSPYPQYRNNIANTYISECNGLILEASTWRILMMPPGTLCQNIGANVCNKFLYQGLYKIYSAEDGTNINLYYYCDRWIISTTNGYEMNNVRWENKTYEAVLREILQDYGHTFESFCAALDQHCCYTFGFKHPDFHRFWEGSGAPIRRMWFIQSVNLNTNSEFYLWNNDSKSPINGILLQKKWNRDFKDFKELFLLAGGALNKFLSHDCAGDDDKKNDEELTSSTFAARLNSLENANLNNICYGFILRSVNQSVTGLNSNLFIESSLMRQIRNIWYDKKMNNYCKISGFPKESSVLLMAYLREDTYQCFTLLFPQYREQFERFTVFFDKIVDELLDGVATFNVLSAQDRAFLLQQLGIYTKNIKKPHEKKTVVMRDKRIIRSFILHPAHFEILNKIYCAAKVQENALCEGSEGQANQLNLTS